MPIPLDLVTAPTVNAFGDSHPGRVRARNEDRFHVDADRGIFIVVDGVGGHAGGGRAADIALEAIRRRLERNTASIPERLREAVTSANEAIYDESRARPDLAGMACVLTAVMMNGERIAAAHVGDTRLYKLRRGAMVKLTRDHSPVGALEDGGRLGEIEAMTHPRRNEVWRDVGTAVHRPEDPGFIDIIDEPFEPDAALLICSDGLTDLVRADDIVAAVHRYAGDPQLSVHALIAAANDAGGRDNVTAIVVEGPEFGVSGPVRPTSTGDAAGGRIWSTLARSVIPFTLGAAVAALLARTPFDQLLSVRPGDAVSAPATAPPRTLRVGTGAGDMATISAALAAARPGDTVVVEAGTYRESLTLRDGIDVVSAERHRAELRRPSTAQGPWTAVTAAGMTSGSLRGFRITGTDTEALSVGVSVKDSVVALDDLDISRAHESAMRIAGTSAPTIHGCALHDNRGFGVQIQDSSAPVISNTAIVNNGRGGIDVTGDAEPTLSWNVISRNGTERSHPVGRR